MQGTPLDLHFPAKILRGVGDVRVRVCACAVCVCVRTVHARARVDARAGVLLRRLLQLTNLLVALAQRHVRFGDDRRVELYMVLCRVLVAIMLQRLL